MRCYGFLSLAAISLAACGGLEPYEPTADTTTAAAGSAQVAPGPLATPAATPGAPTGASTTTDQAAEGSVFIDVAQFEALRAAGASVLDARTAADYAAGHVAGALHAPWERFVDGERSGRLLDDMGALGARVAQLGVSSDRPVLVYGKWNAAWGEEGRLFWMLEYLGHPDVRILAGGAAAYRAAGHSLSTEAATALPDSFVAAPDPALRATASDVKQALDAGTAIVLDIRTLAEYQGDTPHGSPRGGHIPSAVHFHWLEVFDASGALLPADTIRTRFGALGIGDDSLVIAYCTGGIRSGFIYAVMRWAGYPNARNYDGSWWEWSQLADMPVAR